MENTHSLVRKNRKLFPVVAVLFLFLLIAGFTVPAVSYSAVPDVATGSSTSATLRSAIMTGAANANDTATTIWFDYGTATGEYTASTTPQSISGTETTGLSAYVGTLTPYTNYYYRAAAQNSDGTVYGNELSFKPVAQVAAGDNHTLNLKADGTVWAWGWNRYGQLGDGTTTDRTTPLQVSGLSGMVAIAGGYSHSLALKSDGTVWAWGNNGGGQGNTPVQVSGLSGVIAVTAGYVHSLALKSDGTVWAWGSNNYGQLGDGTTTDRITPVQVKNSDGSFLSDVIAVAGGYYYSMALRSDGTVWTWGCNEYGQLGDGTTTNRTTPVQVSGLSGVVGISGRGYHGLALKSDGTVWAWGRNAHYQLGDGTSTTRTTPVQVSGLSEVVAIVSGYYHSLFLKSDGTVWACGYNGYGQLGNAGLWITTPQQVPTLNGVVAIAGANTHSLALKSDGTVWACGWNGYGQLGDGTTTNQTTPVSVNNLNVKSPMATTDTAAGVTISAATLNGTVNGYGTATTVWFDYGMVSGAYTGSSTTQLVDGGDNAAVAIVVSGLSGDAVYYYRIVAQSDFGTSYGAEASFTTDVTGPTGSLSINSGASYTTSAGVTLNLSATDSMGVTGYYVSESSATPSAGDSGWTSVTSTASYSANVSYTLSAGEGIKTIYAWYKDVGGNISSAVSAAITLDSAAPAVAITIPTSDAAYSTSSTLISLGGSASDGVSGVSSVTWSNSAGGSGSASGTTSWTVADVSLAPGSNVITVTATDGVGNTATDTVTVTCTIPTVTTGTATSVSLMSGMLVGVANANDTATTVWFEYGTATGSYFASTTPQGISGTDATGVSAYAGALTPYTNYYFRAAAQYSGGTVYGSESSLKPIAQISAGYSHTICLKLDGTVWAWGNNDSGQLGDGTYDYGADPVQVNGLDDVIDIEAEGWHSLALKSDGTVWAWGNNGSGQLGDGTYDNRTTPVQVNGLSGVVAIAGGVYHNLVLKSDGTVWGWGENSFGQLGDGMATYGPIPAQVSNLSGVVAIACGTQHSLAVKSDGTVWAWGYNREGQLGDGTNTDNYTPVQISGLSDVVAVAGGGQHTIVLKSDGTVWAWGYNGNGQLGDGTYDSRTTPVQISGLSGVVAIMGGSAHSLALKSDETVWAWGGNGNGQLGDGTYDNRTTPVPISGLGSAIAIAGGDLYSLALKSDGTVWKTADSNFVQVENFNVFGPTVATGAATGVTTDSATLNGTVKANGTSTTAWFDYGTVSGVYTGSSTTQVVSGTSTTAVAIDIAGLSDDMVYYYRIGAENGYGSFYGTETSFNTVSQTLRAITGTATSVTLRSGILTGGIRPTATTSTTAWFEYGTSSGTYNAVTALQSISGTNRAWVSACVGTLTPHATYYFRAAAENGDGTVYGGESSLKPIAQISAGGNHTICLKSDGTVWAWGYNGNGQLGDGTTTNRATPVQVSGMNGVIAIAAGNAHTIALKSDGTVWAWGYNGNGQLGDGTTTDSPTPVQITSLSGVVAIGGGYYHGLALKSDGTVWAWGANWSGQLGDGTYNNRITPVQVSGLSGAVAIAGGSSHSLALKSDGTVCAWGANGNGQLGDGTTTDSPTPVQVSGLSGVVAIVCGNSHSLALKSDETVWAWGYNGNGELGNGMTTDSSTPVQVSGLSGVVSIAGGESHSLAMRSDGTIRGWGYNYYGQLGDGTTAWSPTPVQVISLSDVVAVAGGEQHTIALKSDGTVWAWGYNGNGQLGDGTYNNRTTPVQVSGLSGVVAVAGENYHSLALNSDGTVWAWGNNGNGQLGDGTTTDSPMPVQVTSLSGVIAIAGGTYHSLALKSDGTVWAWGNNGNGQLGDGTTTDSPTPVQVSTLSGAIAIAGGWQHTIALKSDGTVWAWGYNWAGQLGDGTTTNSTTPVQVNNLSGTVAIAGGYHFSLALKSDGTVWAWGYNWTGQLGDGTTTDSLTPVQVTNLSGVTAIAGGIDHSLALKSDKTVWAWGANGAGQLGDGTYDIRVTPVQVSGLSSVIAIAGGGYHSLALKSDGIVRAWGSNESGQLGDGTTLQRTTSVQTSNFNADMPPTVATGAATGVTTSSATLNGTVNANGMSTTVWFNYGAASGVYTGTSTVQNVDGTTATEVSVGLSGLSAETNYYYRIAAQNSAGASYGSETSFVTALSADTTPDAFSFTDQTGVALNTVLTSGPITVSGINAAAGISVTGGGYAVNSGAYTTASGTVNNGDTVTVRQTSSASYNTTTNATLTIGGVSDTFSVTTLTGAIAPTPTPVFTPMPSPVVTSTPQVIPSPTPAPGVVTAATGSSTCVTLSSALLNGSVGGNGEAATMWFDYGTASGTYVAATSAQTISGTTTTVGVSASVSGLTPWSNYYYRAVAQNSTGTFYGSETAFLPRPQIAAGSDYTICLKSNGTVWGWGVNGYGLLGDGTTSWKTTPVQTIGLNGVIAVAGGSQHTIALRSDGTVWGCGWNQSGQLGNGTYSDYSPTSVPVQVNSLNNVIAVAGGSEHTIALKSDGTVWAWGRGDYGQLGDGTATNRNTPVQVKNSDGSFLSDVIAIAGGGYHTIALKSDGTVWVWGYTGYSASGDGTSMNSVTPVEVSGLSGVVAIAGGGSHSLVLKSDGTVWAWGDNMYGELGDGTTTRRTIPVEVSGLCGVVAIAGGSMHTVALKSDGTVWAWGANWSGVLGDGSTTSSATPVQVNNFNATSPAATTGIATCVTLSSALLIGWVDGNGETTTAWYEYGTSSGSYTGTTTAVSCGTGTSNVNVTLGNLTPDTTYYYRAAGRNSAGTFYGNENTLLPRPQISAGQGYTMSLKSDGTVWAWGNNGWGQFGNGTTDRSSIPVQVSGMSGVITAVSGWAHTVVLKSDGTVWACGNNSNGQLGDGTTTNSATPVQVKNSDGAFLNDVIAVASGEQHTIALKSDGTVWAWGYNYNGRLGDGTTMSRNTAVQVKNSDGTFLSGVITIACGTQHTLALKQNGTVWAWGYNNNGQLGDGTSYNDRSNPVQVSSLGSVIAIAGGTNHTVALRSNGTVWAWGYNQYGQLGDGTTAQKNTPVQVSGLSGVTAIAGGNQRTMALKSDGTVWAWGYNWLGQLGDGTNTDRSTPVQVSGLSGVIAVSASAGSLYNNSEDHSVALKSDGTVWAWGYGAALGSWTTTNSNTPVQVTGMNLSPDTTPDAFSFTDQTGVALNTVITSDSITVSGINTAAAISVTGGEYAVNSGVYTSGTGTVNSGATVTVRQTSSASYNITTNATITIGGVSDTFSVTTLGGATTPTPTQAAVTPTPVFTPTPTPVVTSTPQVIPSPTPMVTATPTPSTGGEPTVISTIPVGYGPWNLGVNPLTNRIYVANYDGGTVSVIDGATNAVISTITVGSNPQGIGVNSSTNRIYVANWTSHTVSVIDGAINTVTSTISFGSYFYPSDISVNSSTNRVYVTNSSGNPVSVIDGDTNTVVSTITDTGYPSVVRVNSSTNRIYTASSVGNTINVIDGDTNTIVSTISVGTSPLGIGINSSTNRIYVANWSSNTVSVIDGAANTVVSTISVGSKPRGVGVNSSTNCVYVANEDSDTVTVIDGATNTVASTISVGSRPMGVGVNSSTNRIYVTNASGATVSVIDDASSTSTAVISKIAAGAFHTITLKSDGTVWAWGYNWYGQLGDGTTTESHTPVQVSNLSGVTAITGGTDHTIVLKSDGTVWAWGTNMYYQLGDGTSVNRTTPVQVSSLSGVAAITGGSYHTVALKSDGTVRAWGSNWAGQLGDGTYDYRAMPVQVSSLSGVTGIAGGRGHTIALKSDGTVWAWGENWQGQLGDGTTTNKTTPVQVGSLSGVIAIAGGGYHTIALKSDGTVWAWGLNSVGQLGDGTTTNKTTPVQVSSLSGIIAIADGEYHTIALKSDGTVWAWGNNEYGQLGDGTTTNRATPVQVSSLSGITAIAGGFYHTVILKSDGTVWAWGYNGNGQLGDGTTTNSNTPVQVTGLTLSPDTTPDAFSFTDQTNVALNTVITSDFITVSGINTAADVSVTGGEYAVNSGAYTSGTGTVNSGDTVTVRQTSSASYSTTTNATLTIGGVSDTFSVTTLAGAVTPRITSLSPDNAAANGAGFELTVNGANFDSDAVVQWNGASRTTSYVGASQLKAQIPASDLAISEEIVVSLVTVVNSGSGMTSDSSPFTITGNTVQEVQSSVAEAGTSTVVSTMPGSVNQPAVEATVTNDGGDPVTVAVAQYSENPTGQLAFQIDTDCVDVQIVGADAGDSAEVDFYYAADITDASTPTETDLVLYYFDGLDWTAVKSSGGNNPTKNTSDVNIGGFDFGGTFHVVFDNTSTPKITDLSGTVFTMSQPADTTPDAFSFEDRTGVTLNTVITSNTITVSGINGAADISITGGEYAVNSGGYTSVSGTVNNGDTVTVRQTSSASNNTTTNATLTIGGVSDTFSVTTRSNSAPVANAGAAPTVYVGDTVTLDGSGSSDADNDTLTYNWTITSRPTDSGATLTNSTSASPSFTADKAGTYEVSLTVNDGMENSAANTVTITTTNRAPVANAGTAQSVNVGSTVTLDGSGSSDPDSDAITYSWSMSSRPANSSAVLANATSSNPAFVADTAGTYMVELTVSDDGGLTSAATVTITTINRAPMANAGAAPTVYVGGTAALDGSGSSDPDKDAITYSWSLNSRPAGSSAVLANATSSNPAFVADKTGEYVVELTVSDGALSDTATLSITTTNRAPVANAGAGQSVNVGTTVTLNGSGSYDEDGNLLTFNWEFETVPAGSGAMLSIASSVNPTFTVDIPGTYEVRLTVNDGTTDSAVSTVKISTINVAPVADAGADQSVSMGDAITLDGSGSTDADGNPLTYVWVLTTRPQDSTATLNDTTAVNPTFTADKAGTYEVSLMVNDGTVDSAVDTVTISTLNSAPVTDAGADQTAYVDNMVTLDGSGSHDVDGNQLTYRWAFTTMPQDSAAVLSDTTVVNPTFTVDKSGTYVVSLMVNDGTADNAVDTVTISTINSAPVADAGAEQSPGINDTVTLNGSGSHDVDGNQLTYKWAFTARPQDSVATLSDETAVNPTFMVDKSGTYVLSLTVNDGTVGSRPDTVTISTLNVAPVADAGADQSVNTGNVVTLTGNGSTDADGDSLTYVWAFTTRPQDSTAVVSDAAALNPTFTVDKPGTYVVSLMVNDGEVNSAVDTVIISTLNVAPVADAGDDKSAFMDDMVTLDGSGSTDVNGDLLTYRWAFTTKPQDSAATLSDASALNLTFTIDAVGTYVVSLTVNDGTVDSAVDTVTITTLNSAPVADAGSDQSLYVGNTVTLDGSGSHDVDDDLLTYSWELTTRPPGSGATLVSPSSVRPTFTIDKGGTYVVRLTVNDGTVNSAPATVTISTINVAPVADAGADQSVNVDDAVNLDGSGSTDADRDAITYSWSITTRPSGSTAELSGAATASPTFTADVAGTYVAQLVVNDGALSSSPDTVTITAKVVEAEVDIKPETINLKEKGKCKAFIELPAPYTGSDVVVSSVECQGAYAIQGRVDDEGRFIATFNVKDLNVETQSRKEEVVFTVSGELKDGVKFQGSDTVRVKSREKEKEKGKDKDK